MEDKMRSLQIINPGILIRIYWKIDRESKFIDHWGQLSNIAEELACHLNLTKSPAADNTWENLNSRLQIIDPQVNDTLALDYTADGNNEESFWKEAKQRYRESLEAFFKDRLFRQSNSLNNQISPIGMTIVYQGIYNGPEELASLSGKEIVKTTHLESNVDISQRLPGGMLWLVQVPTAKNNDQSNDKLLNVTTAYLALSQNEEEEKMMVKYIYDNQFLYPDLIAHKAFVIQYEYRDTKRAVSGGMNLDDLIFSLKGTIQKIVYDRNRWVDESSSDLQDLAKYFDQLLEISLDLNYLETSVAQQDSNFSYLPEDIRRLKIWEWQFNRIRNYHQEIKLKSEHCQQLLNSASQAVDIFQARIDKNKEIREKKENHFFTLIGLTFAISQLITYETLGDLLVEFKLNGGPVFIFIIQLLLILIITIIIYNIINRLSR